LHRLDLERDLEEYEREQQINAQYVEEFAMLTSEKVSGFKLLSPDIKMHNYSLY